MITPSTRLRRALHLESFELLNRIILSNPQAPELVRNPDFEENGATSLHLAAELGLPKVAAFLLSHGHEDDGISRTTLGLTPLMIAAAAGPIPEEDDTPTNITASMIPPPSSLAQRRVEVARLVIEACPNSTAIRDKSGMDAFAHASRHGTNAVLATLLSRPAPLSALPAELRANVDEYGKVRDVFPHPFLNRRDDRLDTPLHHASAFGHLRTLILLIGAGADVSAQNAFNWTPVAYAASVNIEVQLKALIREREQIFRGQRQSGHSGRDSPIGIQTSGFRFGGTESGMTSADSANSANSSPLRARGASDEKARQLKMMGRIPGGAVGGLRLVRSSSGEGNEDDDEGEIGLAMSDMRTRGRART